MNPAGEFDERDGQVPDEVAAEAREAEGAGQEAVDEQPPAGEGGLAGEERSAAELASALDEAERAAEEYLDHLRRERAEFENFRRRTTKERMEALDRGAEQLIAGLLGVLDNFGYTVEAARASSDDQLGKGVEMVHDELVKALTDAGLQQVPGAGSPFDPTVHEAVAEVGASGEHRDEESEPLVVEVLRPGYRYKGRLLRPASVKVGR